MIPRQIQYSNAYAFGDRTVEKPEQPIKARESSDLWHTHFVDAIKANADVIAELKFDCISVASNETYTKAQPREFRKATRRYKKALADLYAEKRMFDTWEAERQAQRVTKYKFYLAGLAQMPKDAEQLIEINGEQHLLSWMFRDLMAEAVIKDARLSFAPFTFANLTYSVPYPYEFQDYLHYIQKLALHFHIGNFDGVYYPEEIYAACEAGPHMRQWFPNLVELVVYVTWPVEWTNLARYWGPGRDEQLSTSQFTDEVRKLRAAVLGLKIATVKFSAGSHYGRMNYGSFDWV
ncbi:hypothetical protein LTR37_001531 [Vermiconidia calcicola]|uniref:Uncharacterized protein n=1 Tax=Vermiconidia calcicola TaxID=1690605 RepID=A0ACC3NV96_9PEZI|nr:hypothetical protein LTR37_001531 [Vermiconidia calcicola]